MKLFPSQSFFDPETERRFRNEIVRRTTPNTEYAGLVTCIIILIFFVTDLTNGKGGELLAANTFRAAAITIIASTIAINRLSTQNKNIWLAGAFLLEACLFPIFYLSGTSYGTLNEGAAMLVAIGFASLPMLDFIEKFFIWLIFGLFLAWMDYSTSVDMEWTVFYYMFTVAFSCALQFQLDKLLRVQYRAEMIEAEKAATDKLTGTFNRHGFEEFLSKELSSITDREYLHLAMIDIDHFKRFNDHYGHLEGDHALTKIAKKLSNLPVDRVTRFGGEEFILVQKSEEKQPAWINELNHTVMSLALVHEDSPTADVVTISAGVTTVTKDTDISTTELLKKADELLYQAKSAGRNSTLHDYLFD